MCFIAFIIGSTRWRHRRSQDETEYSAYLRFIMSPTKTYRHQRPSCPAPDPIETPWPSATPCSVCRWNAALSYRRRRAHGVSRGQSTGIPYPLDEEEAEELQEMSFFCCRCVLLSDAGAHYHLLHSVNHHGHLYGLVDDIWKEMTVKRYQRNVNFWYN